MLRPNLRSEAAATQRVPVVGHHRQNCFRSIGLCFYHQVERKGLDEQAVLQPRLPVVAAGFPAPEGAETLAARALSKAVS